MSARDFSWGKGGRCVWITTYHPCSAETSRKSGALTYPEPLGPPRPVAGDLYLITCYGYHLQGSNNSNSLDCVTIEDGTHIGCPEMSLSDCQCAMRNILEERGESLKSRMLRHLHGGTEGEKTPQ